MISPKSDLVTTVASSSNDFESETEMVAAMHSNPLSYLHVTKMPLKYPGRWEKAQDYLAEVRDFILDLFEKGVLQQFDQSGYVVYRQTIDGTSHTGVVGLCDMLDYRSNHIKKHEYTRHDTEEFISNLLEATKVIGEPLLLSHHHKQSLEDLLRFIIHQPADLEFEKGNRHHQIWNVLAPELVNNIEKEMREIPDFYIMDGHHRIASVNNLFEKYQRDSYRYALSFVLDANQLSIAPFHRLLTDVTLSHTEILEELANDFEVIEAGDYVLHPANQRSFVLKFSSGTYILNYKSSWAELDVDLLEEKIIKNIFQIQDSRSDQRIQFLPGDEQIDETIAMIQENSDCCLLLVHPCTFREIAMTSDAGKVLPPKSTFVEPKCRAGLFIQSYGD